MQTIYRSHNSPFPVRITDYDGSIYTAARMATITRAWIKYIPVNGSTAEYTDSALAGHEDVFDWATLAATGYMLIDAGIAPNFTEGRDPTAELMVYESAYPEGRMVTLLDLQVTADAEVTPSPNPPATSFTLQPLTVTDDYQVEVADCYRPSVRVNAAIIKTMTMPAMSEDYDGASLVFEIIGDGDVKLLHKGSETMINQTHVSITGTQKYSNITLRYCHAITTWLVANREGQWTGGAE